jgi:hypothetical protein
MSCLIDISNPLFVTQVFSSSSFVYPLPFILFHPTAFCITYSAPARQLTVMVRVKFPTPAGCFFYGLAYDIAWVGRVRCGTVLAAYSTTRLASELPALYIPNYSRNRRSRPHRFIYMGGI